MVEPKTREEQIRLLRRSVEEWNDWRWKLNYPDIDRSEMEEVALIAINLLDASITVSHKSGLDLAGANLDEADLRGADLMRADLRGAVLVGANLSGAYLSGADLSEANLTGANLSGSDLRWANLSKAIIENANLTRCRIYGISAWDLNLKNTIQNDLIITPLGKQPQITVDNLEVAQFIYLLLNKPKIRDVIDTIGKKAVLILGRFSERKNVLELISENLRKRDYLPIVFDFERPADRDFTETIMTLAGMSRFIIADITKPRSVPLESQAIIPNYMIPFVTIIQNGEEPYSMFQDLWQKHSDWVLDPLRYESLKQLESVFDAAVIDQANERYSLLMKKKTRSMVIKDARDYEVLK